MYQSTTLQFLKDLAENNNKPWFEANKKVYEEARQDHLRFVGEIIKRIGAWDEDIAKLEPKDCVFRIYRDVRFSKDKSPYKTNFGAYFSSGRKDWRKAGYYFHLEPGASFLAGGVYQPAADHLKLIRQEIDYNLEEFEGILRDKTFKKWWGGTLRGDKLKKAPKDYPADHPGIEYLKHKDFIAEYKLKDEDILSKGFADTCTEAFRALLPLNRFFDRVWD